MALAVQDASSINENDILRNVFQVSKSLTLQTTILRPVQVEEEQQHTLTAETTSAHKPFLVATDA